MSRPATHPPGDGRRERGSARENQAAAVKKDGKNGKNASDGKPHALDAECAAMKNGWPTKTLGEVCQFRGGGTPSKAVERFWRGNIPWVSPKDMKFDVVSDSIDHISHEAI